MKIDAAKDIGNRLELFVDDWLIHELKGTAEQRLHEPVPQNTALSTDSSWEGNMCGYITAFKDGGKYRMYYKAHHVDIVEASEGTYTETQTQLRIAYAESPDGIHWEKPDLRICEVDGTMKNNIVGDEVGTGQIGTHGFAPFKDSNPQTGPESRYKALGRNHRKDVAKGLYGMQSPDGLHWQLMAEKPVMTKGAFDSQNLAFWDNEQGMYRAFIRDFHQGTLPDESLADHGKSGIRDIRTCTSTDFLSWTEPAQLSYTGSYEEPLYVNQITPYYRAPHLLFGFPTRYVERPWSKAVELLPEPAERKKRSAVSMRYGTVVTDGLFMASRDGTTFHKWPEVFLRPGPQREGNRVYGDNYQSWGLFETESLLPGAPPELSFVATEHYWRSEHFTIFRRYTIRIDGFVSVHANLHGGELITQPITFTGDNLYLNFSTSAAGKILVEIQDPQGTPVKGFTLSDCVESIGDELDRRVYWKDGKKPGVLAGRTVRLRVVLKDADLYAIQFS